jgi:hypothetical protein
MPHYKPIRQKRYENLRKDGFLPKEAHLLSRVPEKVPYLRALKQDRRIILARAIKKGDTQDTYKARITKMYKVKGWGYTGTNANKRIYEFNASAVYKMLREYEDRYKDEKGSNVFKSPWIKKQKVFAEFSRKFDKAFDNKTFAD